MVVHPRYLTQFFSNGPPREKILAIRQGDPLSPYLFTLMADALFRRTSRGVKEGFFKPIEVGSAKFQIPELKFDDDKLFFAQPDMDNILCVKEILDEFC